MHQKTYRRIWGALAVFAVAGVLMVDHFPAGSAMRFAANCLIGISFVGLVALFLFGQPGEKERDKDSAADQ